MKQVLKIAIPVCVVSLLIAAISYGILGDRSGNVVYPTTPVYSGTVFSGSFAVKSHEWEIVNEFPNVLINSSGVNTVIGCGDSNEKRIKVKLSNPDEKTIYVGASYNSHEGSLVIETRPTNVTFADAAEFGKISWLEDIFKPSSNVTVTIEFPQAIYSSLRIQQGSGNVSVKEMYARSNDIAVNSGSFLFDSNSKLEVDNFTFSLNSGKTLIKNVNTKKYNITLNSGTLDVSGLSGGEESENEISVNSGKCDILFSENNKGDVEVDVNSGTVNLYIPENGGACLSAEVTSGYVQIDAFNVKERITQTSDKEGYILGTGVPEIEIGLNSGKVSVLDASQKQGELVFEGVVFSSIPSNTDDPIANSSGYSSSVITSVEVPVELPDPSTDDLNSDNVAEVAETA